MVDPSEGCPLYVVIREGSRTKDINLCDMNNRDGHLFTSETNEIEVYFTTSIKNPHVPKFMLHYRGESLYYHDKTTAI